jgi:hypothetical protein
MVRREGKASEIAGATVEAEPCCTVPAGESPPRVIAGEPGSRPAPEAERPTGEAWCQEPSAAKAVRGEQQRGPQHQVKPAASSDVQSEGRAEHVPAKAMSSARESGWAGGLGGVWGAARAEGAVRNTRGPSAQPPSGKDRPYKPSAKAGGAQRESEGAVVPVRAVKNNAAGGKGPWGGTASAGGKGEGMARGSAPNNPGRQEPTEKVRQLQWKLYVAAKRQAWPANQLGAGSLRSPGPAPTARHHPLPEAVHAASRSPTRKPCAGNPHARFERRWGKPDRVSGTGTPIHQ